MKIEELPSIAKLLTNLHSMRLALPLLRLADPGASGAKYEELKARLHDLDKQVQRQIAQTEMFARLLAPRGWGVTDSLNDSVVKDAIVAYQVDGLGAADEVMVKHYQDPETIRHLVLRCFGAEPLRRRTRLLELAQEDYKCGRLHACVPLLLMMIDGAVAETVGTGFHSDKTALDVWDSITGTTPGIITVQGAFKAGRRKTREESIDTPYRNGILHGLDLAYDNALVAAKSWHFLLVVRDWIVAKQSEPARQEKHAKDTQPVSLAEVLEKQEWLDRFKRAYDNWKPRELSAGYLERLHRPDDCEKASPEETVLRFATLWRVKNYGHMAGLFWKFFQSKRIIQEVRQEFSQKVLGDFRVSEITEKASSLADITLVDDHASYETRVVYEDPDGSMLPRDLGGGEWRVVYAQSR